MYYLKIIKTKSDYEEALDRYDYLDNLDLTEGTIEFDEYDLLAKLIDEYEELKYPIEIPDPYTAIEFELDQRSLNKTDLAKLTGYHESNISRFLNGKRDLPKKFISIMVNEFDIPAEIFFQDEKKKVSKLKTTTKKAI